MLSCRRAWQHLMLDIGCNSGAVSNSNLRKSLVQGNLGPPAEAQTSLAKPQADQAVDSGTTRAA